MKITDFADTFTRDGAEHLQRKIEAYWLNQGFMVETRKVPLDIRRRHVGQFTGDVYVVRSDLINGFPRGRHAYVV